MLERFNVLLDEVGVAALGFSDGVEGEAEVAAYRASKTRFMPPHGDSEVISAPSLNSLVRR
jgi:hypothetical protein